MKQDKIRVMEILLWRSIKLAIQTLVELKDRDFTRTRPENTIAEIVDCRLDAIEQVGDADV